MKISNKNTTIILLLVGMLTCSSCDKFLDVEPSKSGSIPVRSTADIEGLFSAQNNFYIEANRTAVFSTDDYGLTPELYNGGRTSFSTLSYLQNAFWDTEYLPMDLSDSFWKGEWLKIFTANLALTSLDKVTGSDDVKASLKAEGHFIRAYSYWNLVTTYCLPYSESNKNELGLPIKETTSFEDDASRQTLERTYQQIETDLLEALKIPVGLMQTGKSRNWRASKESVNAFAARFYLNKNDYANAIKYADIALKSYSTLVDYNTEMKYGTSQSVVINSGTPTAKTVVLQYPYTHNNQRDQSDMLNWKETLYYRFLTNDHWWYIPSKDLLDLYDKDHDLRFRYHIVENYSYSRSMNKPAYDYPGYIFFFKDKIPSGPTVAEMVLTKAEALARSGDVTGAMNALNILRAKRMLPGTWVNLTAANQPEAIKKVIDERRREMPFVSRWVDIRRYNNNSDPNDDIVLTKSFYPINLSSVLVNEPIRTITLPKNSRRYASPIPHSEIISSNGIIQQNRY